MTKFHHYLVYKNDTVPTYNLLVEKYLQPRKGDNGRLFDLSFRNSINGTKGTSLNCWRGYQAIYKIENDSLFVSAIIDCHSIENAIEISEKYSEIKSKMEKYLLIGTAETSLFLREEMTIRKYVGMEFLREHLCTRQLSKSTTEK